MLQLHQVTLRYPGAATPVLDNLSLNLPVGQSASIRGASGCGKSTLLAVIAGLAAADKGLVQVGDHVLSDFPPRDQDAFRRQSLGLVYQQFNLLSCFNVWDNIAFTARLKGNYQADYQHKLMALMNIGHLAKAPLTQLSGGEQQRVAICRALNHQPALVLADEPTGNLDEATSERVADALYTLCRETHTTLVVVTHSVEVATQADTCFRLHNGRLETLTGNGEVQ